MDPVTAAIFAYLPARYAVLLLALSGLAAWVTATFRPPANPILAALWRGVNTLAANVWNARNAVAPVEKTR